MKSVALMTAFNEGKRIKPIILKAKKHVDKVIVVDDGSTDNTCSVSKKAGATVIRYSVNMGKGYALRIGLKKALTLKPGIIVFLDADGQHKPEYIPQFIEAIKKGADYVYGKRNLSKYPFSRKLGNFGLTLLTNLLCPTGIMDTECGFRALTSKSAKKLSLKADSYGIEMDFAYSAWKNKFKISKVKIEVPVFHPKSAFARGFSNFSYLLYRRFNI
jgi:glycosyltransferase involved in cell wall biosynthesis